MSPLTALLLACSVVLSGCGSATPHKAADTGNTTLKAAQKIDRICALPQAERDTELKKLQEETGVVLFCGK